MSGKRYLLLEVDETKADDLLTALLQRSYIRNVNLLSVPDRDGFESCPACKEELTPKTVLTVTEQMVYGCLQILLAMKENKTVVIYNKSYLDEVRPVDRSRAVPFPYKHLYGARLLGLVDHFMDGSQSTFFVTRKGIDFLSGDEELSPSKLTVVHNKIIESSGSMWLDDVKRKEVAVFSSAVLKLRETIKALSTTTVQFIDSGQVPLI